MSAILFYAMKELKKNKKAFAFIIIAIALSTANIIVLTGLLDGVNENLVERAIETSSAHLSIYPNDMDRYIEGLGIKEKKMDGLSQIVGYSPRINAGGAISYKDKSKSIKIMALDPSKENKVTTILTKIDSGATLEDKNDILVSYRVANDLKIKVGDQASILFENGNTAVFKIKGILRTGTAMDLNTVVMNFEDAQEQLGLNNKASIIMIKLLDKNLATAYKTRVSQELGVQKVKEWKQEVESIISTSETFRGIANTINAVGLFASAISVGVILYITVLHKRRQIGILKAIGLKDSQVLSIYVVQATLIGTIGVALGDVIGYAGTKFLEAHPFADPVVGNMAPRFYPYLIYNASLITLLVVILASLYPAIIAARMNIIKAIWEA
jgi:putative ABC transport system permease protein